MLVSLSGRAQPDDGGDAGIRTRGSPLRLRRFSKPLVSATHPRLRAPWGKWRPARQKAAYNRAVRGWQRSVTFGRAISGSGFIAARAGCGAALAEGGKFVGKSPVLDRVWRVDRARLGRHRVLTDSGEPSRNMAGEFMSRIRFNVFGVRFIAAMSCAIRQRQGHLVAPRHLQNDI